MLDHVRGLTVRAYGHSFLAWSDRWSYLNRLRDTLAWSVTNAAVGGERAVDVAARVIGSGSTARWTPRAAHLAVLDCATNDMFSLGLDGLDGYRNALRAMLAYLSCEGPMDSADLTYATGPGHSWSTETSPDRHNGSARVGGTLITAPGFGRAGKWAFGHAGIPAALGPGARFAIEADGIAVGAIDCHAAFVATPARNRTACATVVTSDTPVITWTLRRTRDGGGPWIDWYGKLDEATPPLIVLPTPVRSPAAAYALPGARCTDAVVDAYAAVLRDVAAEVGPHCLVVDTAPGWDPVAMMRRSDPMHPNARGHAHIASAITDTLAATTWWPATD